MEQVETSCIHDYFTGTEDMLFEHYVNSQDTIEKWWKKKHRAFVVYVSENGHRQWPVGGGVRGLASSVVEIHAREEGEDQTHDSTIWKRHTIDSKSPGFVVGSPGSVVGKLRFSHYTHTTELIDIWRQIERLIDTQSKEYQDAYHTSTKYDYNMADTYRGIRNGMEDRIQKMYAHVNYGRGIPVIIPSINLTPDIISLLGSRVKAMESSEWSQYNMTALQQLEDEALTARLQRHMEQTALFLTKLENKEGGTPGAHAEVPTVMPTIVHQTQQQVAITITPGPAWKTTEFEESDVWLVGDDDVMMKEVPPLKMTENTWTQTVRVAGIVKVNPLKGKQQKEVG
eukprot:6416730-Amphidinium_carterae.1